jgi:hypothetical protein
LSRKRLAIAVTCAAMLVGACVVAVEAHDGAEGGRSANQPTAVVPRLVPDVGGLHVGSEGTASAPERTGAGIWLIPSAGGPVRAYGGSGSGTILAPTHR